MKVQLSGLALIFAAAPAGAHDFWIQPIRYQLNAGQPFGATLQVGHGKDRQRWGNDVSRVPLLLDISGAGRTDLRSNMRPGPATDIAARLTTPGLHIIALQSVYASSDLPAVRFNQYLKDEGLSLPLAARTRAGRMKLPGRERYSRRAKTLVQVGPQTVANGALATRPVGLKLEIVPEKNPYALDRTRRLPVQVLYKGKPLAGASVRLTRLEADERPLASKITDRSGRATFVVPPVGSWLINVLWSEPLAGNSEADFDTVFSSLTFGYAARSAN
jgi:uncharacterized GH25 family protein